MSPSSRFIEHLQLGQQLPIILVQDAAGLFQDQAVKDVQTVLEAVFGVEMVIDDLDQIFLGLDSQVH
jgi:hypothetical protein